MTNHAYYRDPIPHPTSLTELRDEHRRAQASAFDAASAMARVLNALGDTHVAVTSANTEKAQKSMRAVRTATVRAMAYLAEVVPEPCAVSHQTPDGKWHTTILLPNGSTIRTTPMTLVDPPEAVVVGRWGNSHMWTYLLVGSLEACEQGVAYHGERSPEVGDVQVIPIVDRVDHDQRP